MVWTPLEDLAVRSNVDSEEYKFVVEQKGADAVRERKKFLQIE